MKTLSVSAASILLGCALILGTEFTHAQIQGPSTRPSLAENNEDRPTTTPQETETEALVRLLADDSLSLEELGLRLDRYDQILEKALVVMEKLEKVREKRALAELLFEQQETTAEELSRIVHAMSSDDETDPDDEPLIQDDPAFADDMVIFARDNGMDDMVAIRVRPTEDIRTLNTGDKLTLKGQEITLLGVHTENEVVNATFRIAGKTHRIALRN